MCSVVWVEADNIHLEMNEWPVTIMADVCSTNVSAGNKIWECFGLVFPSIRYVAAHASDGSLKDLTNSRTMNDSNTWICTTFLHYNSPLSVKWEKYMFVKERIWNAEHENCLFTWRHYAWQIYMRTYFYPYVILLHQLASERKQVTSFYHLNQ